MNEVVIFVTGVTLFVVSVISIFFFIKAWRMMNRVKEMRDDFREQRREQRELLAAILKRMPLREGEEEILLPVSMSSELLSSSERFLAHIRNSIAPPRTEVQGGAER